MIDAKFEVSYPLVVELEKLILETPTKHGIKLIEVLKQFIKVSADPIKRLAEEIKMDEKKLRIAITSLKKEEEEALLIKNKKPEIKKEEVKAPEKK